MSQCIKAPDVNPHSLSSITRTHCRLESCSLTSTNTPWYVSPLHCPPYTQINLISNKEKNNLWHHTVHRNSKHFVWQTHVRPERQKNTLHPVILWALLISLKILPSFPGLTATMPIHHRVTLATPITVLCLRCPPYVHVSEYLVPNLTCWFRKLWNF